MGPFRRTGAGFGTSSMARLPRFRSAYGWQASKGEPPTFCRGQAPERLRLICGWLPGIYSSGNGRRLTCRTSRWMLGIFRPASLACSGGALAGCRAYRPGWCRKRGLSGHGGLADGISKVGFPRWGRSAARGQASVRLLWQGFQGSVQPTGGRPPRWNPSTFNIIRIGTIPDRLPGHGGNDADGAAAVPVWIGLRR